MQTVLNEHNYLDALCLLGALFENEVSQPKKFMYNDIFIFLGLIQLYPDLEIRMSLSTVN